MKILVYIVEWIITCIVIGLLNWGMNYLFRKKLNKITAAIFSFVLIGLFVFLFSSYLLSFPEPEIFYLPILLFFFIFTLVEINKKEKKV